jgi:hypothetical protein
MRIFRAVVIVIIGGLAALFLVPATSSNAAGVTEWVGTAPTVVGGKACGTPAFNSVQAAVNAAPAGSTIQLCPGTYTEQVQITKNLTITGQNSPTLRLPSTPADSSTTCDTSIPVSYQANQDEVSICGAAKVTITGVRIYAAWPAATCYDSMYGVFVGGGATLTLSSSSIVAAGARPINGCQGGIGIQIGTTRTSPAEVGHLTASKISVAGYQKNGIDVVGAGSTGTISNSIISGAGETTAIAQNGIEVADGALATLRINTITGNECDVASCGPDSLLDTQSGGILLLDAASGTLVSQETIADNDIGIYFESDTTPAPKTFTVKLSTNTLTNNRYEGVVLDQGWADLDSNKYSGGNVGIQALQYDGQTYGGTSVDTRDQLSGQSVAAVQVDSDNAVTDVAGKFTISYAHFHGGAVTDNSTNYPIIQHGNNALN